MNPNETRKTSRCTTEQSKPLKWVEIFDLNSKGLRELDVYISELSKNSQDELIGSTVSLRALASLGRLRQNSDELKPLATFPDAFELRWIHRSESGRTLIRQYHVEPPQHPKYLVASHIHIKSTSGSQVEINRKQNLEIEYAKQRFLDCQPLLWHLH